MSNKEIINFVDVEENRVLFTTIDRHIWEYNPYIHIAKEQYNRAKRLASVNYIYVTVSRLSYSRTKRKIQKLIR